MHMFTEHCSVLLCTEVSSGILSAIATHLNQTACTKPMLSLHVAQNILDPRRGGEDEKATWDVFVWKVAAEKAELELQVMDEGGQVGGEDVEANPQTGWNPLGLCEDAERICTFHQCSRLWIEDVVEILFAARPKWIPVNVKNSFRDQPLPFRGLPHLVQIFGQFQV